MTKEPFLQLTSSKERLFDADRGSKKYQTTGFFKEKEWKV
jgi:hypothetical protein